MKRLFFLIILCISSKIDAARYYIYNESSPLTIEGYVNKKSSYTLKDFRFRIVAEELFGNTQGQAMEWLEDNQLIAPKAMLPQILSESGYTEINNSQKATKKLTLLVSADGIVENKPAVKFFLCALDIELPHKIAPDEVIKFDINKLYLEKNNLKADFKVLMNKKDFGFAELPNIKISYLPRK